MEKKKIRIGFENFTTNLWKAGEIYQKNLFSSIKKYYPDEVEIILFSNPNNTQISNLIQPFINEILFFPEYNNYFRTFRSRLITKVVIGFQRRIKYYQKIKSRGFQVSEFMKTHDIDVYFSQQIFDEYFEIPSLCWIPDFQSFHYPELFSKILIEERMNYYERCIKFADRIILSGHAAKKDFIEKFPQASKKVRVFPFVSSISDEIYNTDPEFVISKYNLPNKFFFLPNQIWKHKNHGIVLEALNILKKNDPEIIVVASGLPYDDRNPTHFAELLTKVATYNIHDTIIFLGMIPYNDVINLMRSSIAVLQPSLFEGWSTTVEEVKSIGKTIILSDIPVHRDQNPSRGIFFCPQDAYELAMQMRAVFYSHQAGLDKKAENQARSTISEQIMKNAQDFISIVQEII
jgi:glycosyltransferase involved in cell wall biosynthesis